MRGFPGSGSGTNVSKKRLIILCVIIISIFLFFLYRLFSLQIINNDLYRQKALDVSERSEVIPSQRGQIFDRNYDKPLAVNREAFAIQITRSKISGISADSLADKLAGVLLVSKKDLLRKFPDSSHQYEPVQIMAGIPYEKIVYIAEHIDEFPGVSWSSRPARFYNQTGSISHILGYTGSITASELQVLYNKGYSGESVLGKSGIEKQYDSILRGTDGRRIKTVDVKGRTIKGDESIVPPVNGLNVKLTIDRHIQLLAEKALGKRKGSVVVLQPSTGEIIAMVSYPSFNPNLFSQSGPMNYGALSLSSDFPFLNRAIQSAYAPASTFKLIMTTALLDLDAIDPEKKIVCNGFIMIGNRKFWCWKRSGHGPLNLREALEESCNIYFATAGMNYLGIDNISRYAGYLGLGEPTGVDIPGEVKGNIPTEAWKEKEFNESWQIGDTANTSIGQGFVTSTPLQVADEVAMIVNEGVVYKPHFLKEIIDPQTGAVTYSDKKEILRRAPVKQKTFRTLKEYMRDVVKEGTSSVVILNDQVKVAGKTGTAEVGLEDHWHSWFASFGPYETDNPDDRYVVVTMVEATNDWEWWAPKAADIIYEGIFGHKTYEQVIRDFKRRRVWYAMDIDVPPADN